MEETDIIKHSQVNSGNNEELHDLGSEPASQFNGDLDKKNGQKGTSQEEERNQPQHKVDNKTRQTETSKHERPSVQSTTEETGTITHNQVNKSKSAIMIMSTTIEETTQKCQNSTHVLHDK